MGKQARRERREEEEHRKSAEEGFSEADRRFSSTLEFLARGIIIGGSLGVFAGWILPGVAMSRMVFLGLLCGCLGGITMRDRADRKKKG